MSDLAWAVGLTAVSVGIMWLRCVRPMRRGQCAPRAERPDVSGELAALRREITQVREQRTRRGAARV